MIESVVSRLALGAAQFGMPYGIANTTGQPSIETAQRIVTECWRAGVRYFDTAQAYGNSEAVLGQTLRDIGIASEARVVSKLSPALYAGSKEAILASLQASLAQLGLRRLWGVLLHREEQLDQWNDTIGEAFDHARRKGLVAHVGVSVYSPQRALQALACDGLDVIQVPANVFDRRMKGAGVFQQALACGVTVFIRSAYLQGLALLPVSRVGEVAPFAVRAAEALEKFCHAEQLDRQEFILQYAFALDTHALVVVGAETEAQIASNCRTAARPTLPPKVAAAWDDIWPEDDEVLINPSRWPSMARR